MQCRLVVTEHGIRWSDDCHYNTRHLPVIPIQVEWVCIGNDAFDGIAFRDNQGWANLLWNPFSGFEWEHRQHWQCEFCGAEHAAKDCPY